MSIDRSPADATLEPADGATTHTGQSVPPARRREISERLASGFYDTDEVRDAIAHGVAADLAIRFRE